jgi:hypothetical protein
MARVALNPWFAEDRFATGVWLSRNVEKLLLKKKREEGRGLLQRMEEMAESGFELFIGPKNIIRHEWDQIYRIGLDSSQLRVIGFFEQVTEDFLGVDGFVKKGQQLTAQERDLINRVRDIRNSGDWEKK